MSSAVIRHMADLDLRGNALRNAAFEQLSAAPSSPGAGRVYFDTTLGVARVYSGTAWLRMDDATAMAAVEALQAQVESDLVDAIADETSARTAADGALGARVDGVLADVADEATARIAADTALQGSIDAVATASTTAAATAKSEAITAAGSYTDGRISDLVAGAPAALDTLAEIAAAIEDDADAVAGILTALGTKQASATLIGDVRAGLKFAGTYTVSGEFSQTVEHGLGTDAVQVSVFEGNDLVEVAVSRSGVNTVVLSGNTGGASATLNVVIVG